MLSALVSSLRAGSLGRDRVSALDTTGAPVTIGAAGVRVDIAGPGSGVLSIGPRGRDQLTGSGAYPATGSSRAPQRKALIVTMIVASASPPPSASGHRAPGNATPLAQPVIAGPS